MTPNWADTRFPVVAVSRVAELQLGKMLQPAPATVADEPTRYLRAGSLSRLDAEDYPEMFASPLDRKKYQVVEGDLLVAEGGDVGRAEFARAVPSGTIIQNSLHRLRSGTADIRFVKYALDAVYASGWLEVYCSKSTFGHLTLEKLAALTIPAPSHAIQSAIADYLDAETGHLDTLLSHRRRMMSLLEARFLERVRASVTGGLSLPDPLNVRDGDISVPGWIPVKLAADLHFGSGTTPTAGDERYYGPGTPWIMTANLRDAPILEAANTITDEALRDFSSLKVHPAGSLVVAMYGATIGRLGITTFPAAVNQACCVMHSGRLVDVGFLFYYLLSHRNVLVERAVGAGQPNISQEILRSLRVPVPSRAQQAVIVDELRRLGSQALEASSRLGDQADLLLERRQALIAAAVTGQLNLPGIAA